MKAASAQARARALGLSRRFRFWERGGSWFAFALVVGIGLLLLLRAFVSGSFQHLDPDLFAPVVRGHSGYGEILGVLAVLFVLGTLLFSLRKRALQERFPLFRGTMMAWLWFHVACGVLALLASTLHAGFGLLDYEFSTGKLLYYLLLLVSISGVVWRTLYAVVPASVATRIGNYSRAASRARAQEQELEMAKLVAGRGELLQQWKAWLEERPRSEPELVQAAANFQGSADAPVFAKLCELAKSRNRALERNRLQKRAIERLQFLRVWHVPASLLFALLVIAHVVEVYDAPAKVLPPLLRKDTSLPVELTGFHDPKACRECHRAIYDQWEHSMHAHALTSPLMVVQSNQVTREILGQASTPDPRRLCVNCHSPIGTDLAQQEMLPFPGGQRANEGVTCTVCHQFVGDSRPVGGARSDGFPAGLDRGRVMYGPFAGAVGNPYHSSKLSPVMAPDPFVICENCHNVAIDRNENGAFEPGPDLVLQTTQLEYVEYRRNGGKETCGDCHMPVIQGVTRVAESATIPELQDSVAPPRLLHDHSFVGTDYPLDRPGRDDPHRQKRVALLQRAAALTVEDARFDARRRSLDVTIEITNTGTGHKLPSGFAFARQMWVELVVRDLGKDQALFASGLLASAVQDLCDTGTLEEPNSPMLPFVLGCKTADPQLVNFQTKLVDKSDVKRDAAGRPVTNARGEQIPVLGEGGHETSIQHLTGNAVPRTRKSDGQLMVALEPGESRSFDYRVAVPPGAERIGISARLMFRNLPPYFLRHLASRQPRDEVPQLLPLVENLDLVEMAVAERQLTVPSVAALALP